MTTVNYGEVQMFLVCQLPKKKIFKDFQGQTFILAIITPCKTDGKDARLGITSYKEQHKRVAIDVRTIQAVVGRVYSRKRWWIIDRFDAAIPTFDELNEKNYEDEDKDNEGRDA
jgi:hypothetical protein